MILAIAMVVILIIISALALSILLVSLFSEKEEMLYTIQGFSVYKVK